MTSSRRRSRPKNPKVVVVVVVVVEEREAKVDGNNVTAQGQPAEAMPWATDLHHTEVVVGEYVCLFWCVIAVPEPSQLPFPDSKRFIRQSLEKYKVVLPLSSPLTSVIQRPVFCLGCMLEEYKLLMHTVPRVVWCFVSHNLGQAPCT